MIRAILVDDEESALTWLGDVLSSQPEIEVVGTATSVAEALTLMNAIRPDVVFLDISMPRQCGMTLFASVDAAIRIVLVTAHDDRALEAFDAGAFDYLLKPVTVARLAKTVDRLSHSLRPPAPVPLPSDQRDRITLSTPSGTILLPTEHVLWIEARQNYSLIHRAAAEPLLVKRLLGDFGEELPSRRFARIGRSLVINLEALRSVGRIQGNGATLQFADSSETLVIGRAAMARLRQLLAVQPFSEELPQ
jgi:two-component system LytT family response regulator